MNHKQMTKQEMEQEYESMNRAMHNFMDENQNLRARIGFLEAALREADSVIQEEVNLSNYDHETVCRIAAMWEEAHGVILNALTREQEANDDT